MRVLFALLALLLTAAGAMAANFSGPLILSAIPDAARYAAGALARVDVTLSNQTGTPFTGTVTASMTGRGVDMGLSPSAAITNLLPGRSITVSLDFPLPDTATRNGYLVALTAATSAGAVVDSAATALDASADWAIYPRECFVTNFTGNTDTASMVRGLSSLHCNVLQFYDVNVKHQLPYSSADSWYNLGHVLVNAGTVRQYIANAHMAGMASLVYTLWNGVYDQFQSDGTGVSLNWGMFLSNCGASCSGVAAGANNLDATPANSLFMTAYCAANPNGTLGGATPVCSGTTPNNLFPSSWSSLSLLEMNPVDPNWTAYWTAATEPLITHFGYDGLQIDTLGNPGTRYTAGGATIDFSTALSGFVAYARGKLATRGVINNVSRWTEAQVAASPEDFYYSELHPEFGDTSTFPALNGAVASVRSVSPTKGIDFAFYMNEDASNAAPCSTAGGTTQCFANGPGLRYADATVLAAGAYHVYLADGDRIISNIYVPGAQLSLYPLARQTLLDYQSFGVAQERLLRDGVSDSYQPVSITPTSGCAGSTVGAAGAVYTLPKIRAGLQIAHLLNYCALTSIQPQDRAGTQPAPPHLLNVPVKMYYAGFVTGANRLWLGSPDIAHGVPQTLSYTKGADGTGTFITFTVPSLDTWDMMWLELDALPTSDYAAP